MKDIDKEWEKGNYQCNKNFTNLDKLYLLMIIPYSKDSPIQLSSH